MQTKILRHKRSNFSLTKVLHNLATNHFIKSDSQQFENQSEILAFTGSHSKNYNKKEARR